MLHLLRNGSDHGLGHFAAFRVVDVGSCAMFDNELSRPVIVPQPPMDSWVSQNVLIPSQIGAQTTDHKGRIERNPSGTTIQQAELGLTSSLVTNHNSDEAIPSGRAIAPTAPSVVDRLFETQKYVSNIPVPACSHVGERHKRAQMSGTH